jgi:hypothetical protein
LIQGRSKRDASFRGDRAKTVSARLPVFRPVEERRCDATDKSDNLCGALPRQQRQIVAVVALNGRGTYSGIARGRSIRAQRPLSRRGTADAHDSHQEASHDERSNGS